MKKLLNLFLFFVLTVSAYAQPYTAGFRAVNNTTRGCVPFTVSVEDLSGSEADPQLANPFYYYGAGGDTSQRKTYTYSQPGIYSITQFVQTGGNPPTDKITRTGYIEVLPKPKPVFTVNYCQDRIVTVQIEEIVYEEYVINFGDGSQEVIISGTEIAEHVYSNSNPKTITVTGRYVPGNCGEYDTKEIYPLDQLIQPDILFLRKDLENQATLNFYAYRNHRYTINRKDPETGEAILLGTVIDQEGESQFPIKLEQEGGSNCFFVSAEDCNTSLISDVICLISDHVRAENNENIISWTSYPDPPNFHRYLIFRDNEVIHSTTENTSTSFSDKDIICGNEYCYRIAVETININSEGEHVSAFTNQQCITAITTTPPPPVSELNSTIEGENIKLQWGSEYILPDETEFNIYRSVNGTDFNSYRQSTGNTFIDKNITVPGNTYCYQIFFKNACNLSPETSPVTCPVILDARQGRQDINIIEWTPYSGTLENEQTYVLEKLNESLQAYSSVPVGSALTTDDTQEEGIQVMRYRILVNSAEDPGMTSYSNIKEIRYRIGVFPPNTFTPNNDGLNDTFEVKGRFVKSYSITIFNKWGEIVYKSNDMSESWDGTVRGNPPVPGAYAYVLEAEDYTGEKINKRGTITIIFK